VSTSANDQTSEYFSVLPRNVSGNEHGVLRSDGLDFHLAVCGGATYMVFERH
jgi:hypothetical protein